MKRLSVFLFVIFATLSCSKESDTAHLPVSTTATIDYLGDPALGGLGWVLRIGTEYEVPTALADEFKVDELEVSVTFKRTDQVFPCRCAKKVYMVEIISINKN